MTTGNLHLCTQAYASFSAGDVDGLLQRFHPEAGEKTGRAAQ